MPPYTVIPPQPPIAVREPQGGAMPETERPDEHEGHAFVASGSHAGRRGSWLAVIMILIGFTVGGVGLCLGPSWILIGVGIGLMVIGGVIAMAVDIFS